MLLIFQLFMATALAAAPAQKPAPAAVQPAMRSATQDDEKKLSKISDRYRLAKTVSMKVAKTLKLGLLGEERKSTGQLWLSKGQLRMELAGSEKTLLVVNKNNLWAVTYPAPEFKDAAVQVIKAQTNSKKAKAQALTGLLGAGGFAKSFKATAVQVLDGGDVSYFLQPAQDQSDFKRAQIRVAKDAKSIVELHYWDERDNETIFQFSETTFGAKSDPKLFEFTPPVNADVMTL